MSERPVSNPYHAPKSRGAGQRSVHFRAILYGLALLGMVGGALMGALAPDLVARYLGGVLGFRLSRLNWSLTCGVAGLVAGGLLGAAVSLFNSLSHVYAMTDDMQNKREELLLQARRKSEARAASESEPEPGDEPSSH